jgi:putative PIN family toxin of toxin-antitoxin system
MSEHLLDEVGHTLIKRYFQERISAADREAAVAILRRQSRRVTPASGVEGVATHPEDDLVLATAVAAKAVLVTGDRQLLRIGTHQGVRTVNVRSFLEELQSKGGEDA